MSNVMPSGNVARYRNRRRAVLYALVGGCGLSGVASGAFGGMFMHFVKFGPVTGDVLDARAVGVLAIFFFGLLPVMGVSAWIGAVGGLAVAEKRDNAEFGMPPESRAPIFDVDTRTAIERQRSLVTPALSEDELQTVRSFVNSVPMRS